MHDFAYYKLRIRRGREREREMKRIKYMKDGWNDDGHSCVERLYVLSIVGTIEYPKEIKSYTIEYSTGFT